MGSLSSPLHSSWVTASFSSNSWGVEVSRASGDSHLTPEPDNRSRPWVAPPINHLTFSSLHLLPLTAPSPKHHPRLPPFPLPTRVVEPHPPFRMTASINLTEVITHQPLGGGGGRGGGQRATCRLPALSPDSAGFTLIILSSEERSVQCEPEERYSELIASGGVRTSVPACAQGNGRVQEGSIKLTVEMWQSREEVLTWGWERGTWDRPMGWRSAGVAVYFLNVCMCHIIITHSCFFFFFSCRFFLLSFSPLSNDRGETVTRSF